MWSLNRMAYMDAAMLGRLGHADANVTSANITSGCYASPNALTNIGVLVISLSTREGRALGILQPFGGFKPPNIFLMPTYRLIGSGAKHRLEPLLKNRGWDEASDTIDSPSGVDEGPIGFLYETAISRKWRDPHRYVCVCCLEESSVGVRAHWWPQFVISLSQP